MLQTLKSKINFVQWKCTYNSSYKILTFLVKSMVFAEHGRPF